MWNSSKGPFCSPKAWRIPGIPLPAGRRPCWRPPSHHPPAQQNVWPGQPQTRLPCSSSSPSRQLPGHRAVPPPGAGRQSRSCFGEAETDVHSPCGTESSCAESSAEQPPSLPPSLPPQLLVPTGQQDLLQRGPSPPEDAARALPHPGQPAWGEVRSASQQPCESGTLSPAAGPGLGRPLAPATGSDPPRCVSHACSSR